MHRSCELSFFFLFFFCKGLLCHFCWSPEEDTGAEMLKHWRCEVLSLGAWDLIKWYWRRETMACWLACCCSSSLCMFLWFPITPSQLVLWMAFFSFSLSSRRIWPLPNSCCTWENHCCRHQCCCDTELVLKCWQVTSLPLSHRTSVPRSTGPLIILVVLFVCLIIQVQKKKREWCERRKKLVFWASPTFFPVNVLVTQCVCIAMVLKRNKEQLKSAKLKI